MTSETPSKPSTSEQQNAPVSNVPPPSFDGQNPIERFKQHQIFQLPFNNNPLAMPLGIVTVPAKTLGFMASETWRGVSNVLSFGKKAPGAIKNTAKWGFDKGTGVLADGIGKPYIETGFKVGVDTTLEGARALVHTPHDIINITSGAVRGVLGIFSKKQRTKSKEKFENL